ncbi:MAG: hypothetical protein VW268_09815 [Rhodospirillaceae bacterium]
MASTGILIAIAFFGALGILAVLFYASTLAKNVYVIKVQMKDDLQYEVGKMKDFVEKEMAQHQKWMMRELEGMVGGKDGGDASAEVQLLRVAMQKEPSLVNEKVRKIEALQQALAAKKKQAQPAPQAPAMEPVFKAEGPGKKAAG